MLRYIIFLLLLGSSATAWAQTTGGLYGQIVDPSTDEGLPFANLVLLDNTFQIAAAETDFNGNYNFSNVPSGTYELVIQYPGYPTRKIPNTEISAGSERRLDIEMGDAVVVDSIVVGTISLPPVLCLTCEEPNKIIRDAEFIKNNPERGGAEAIKTVAGVGSPDEGEAISASGSRLSSNLILVNDVPTLTGGVDIADVEIQEVQVMQVGIPARYGNATGSITNIITKGPSTQFRGGFQAETSQFLDALGATTINAFFSGPLLSKPITNTFGDTLKYDNGKVRRRSILGYRISGAYFSTRDPRPSALGFYRLDDDKLQDILKAPLTINPTGSGSVHAADFLEEDDIDRVGLRSNATRSSFNYNAALEAKPSSDFFVSLSSQGEFNWGTIAAVENQLFNYQFNPLQRSNILGFTGRFRHTVSSTIPGNSIEEEEENLNRLQPVFQNFSYEFIGSYNQTYFEVEDPRYNDRLWEYGYVGKFYESRRPIIGVVDTATGALGHAAFFNSFDRYEPNRVINPGLAAYNDLLPTVGSDTPGGPTALNEMEIINGLVTGNRNNVYGLFNAPHLTNTGYGKRQNSQYRIAVKTQFELLTNQASGRPIRHKILLGGVFEQRIERQYNINPFALWNRAYQTTNAHISNAADLDRPTGEVYYDPNTRRQYALYQNLVREDENGNEASMSAFATNLRQQLGLDKRDWISVHELTPDQMRLDWFAPSTLITGNQRIINYYGYDYLGNPIGQNVSFNDFFTATNAEGRKTRPVAPFAPIYLAGYIEDRFIYKDFICHVGLRVDRYDANTKVLNDPYSIVGYETAAEFESDASLYRTGQTPEYRRPSNIGDDYAVYVNQNSADAAVVGYRNGNQWYDANGIPVNTSNELGAVTIPALKGFGSSQVDPQGDQYNPDLAFKDYTPELIIMPRISLSFPISESSNFYANYDILSQRPPVGGYASAFDIYNFRELTANSRVFSNSSLKPEQTINYEVGFQQLVTPFSKLRLALAYKEERNLIQLQQYVGAYPNTYTTYDNQDFSTTKIFKLEYETARHKNLSIIANYTLQFSDGTGSTPNSSAGVAARELKYVFPLDFDQRHTLYTNINYRFGQGEAYDGPRIGKVDVLANTGLSVSINANSGRPYTRKVIPGNVDRSFPDRITNGSVNGARMPWNFRLSLKLDRSFIIGKKSAKPLMCNIYLRISNLFNTQNILDVYAATGSPTDDGFLTFSNSSGPGFAASQPEAYALLYRLRENDPFNISRPRRIFVGMSVAF